MLVTTSDDDSAARRVLVVDDDIDSAEMLAEVVSHMGHETRTALDGPSAIRVAREFRPHVVLLDIGLPGMDGYEVARQLRSEPMLGRVILTALSGFSSQRYQDLAREAGLDHYLVKPVDFARLSSLLRGNLAAET